ncbi:alpha/beta-type small acid-soluble spore protein [Chengkuizengella sediminis]|uniref:alpha/beta-type small acid-soluble spore protein n=1 Tax=Chengkuizengella sediminis TaxID=1885917 RepID=UPI001389D52E|nr:alpha/beta-type small acid-soluble spore protein [Chengkuizengella sediminis]NDI36534.1 alpha/beta-type small acid-soluble spore protein [Chengkuizengella sediminis]
MANKKVVPGCESAINQWKYEFASELGLSVGQQAAVDYYSEFASELGTVPKQALKEDYWGHISARESGAVGGAITARLIQQAEQVLLNS